MEERRALWYDDAHGDGAGVRKDARCERAKRELLMMQWSDVAEGSECCRSKVGSDVVYVSLRTIVVVYLSLRTFRGFNG